MSSGNDAGNVEDDLTSGLLQAWFLKKKSGHSLLRLRQYNKRFFTIDFDSCVFHYAHKEKAKKVSCLVPFSDILGAILQGTAVEEGEEKRGLRRSSSSVTDGLIRLTVLLQGQKKVELLCNSDREALRWYQAFMTAKERGNVLYGPGEGSNGDNRKVAAAVSAAWAAAAGQEPESEADDASPPKVQHHDRASPQHQQQQQQQAFEASPVRARPAAETQGMSQQQQQQQQQPSPRPREHGEDALTPEAPQKAPGTFLDLSVADGGHDDGIPGPSCRADVSVPSAAAEHVEQVETITMQAADFGFEDLESSGDESEASGPMELPFLTGHGRTSSPSGDTSQAQHQAEEHQAHDVEPTMQETAKPVSDNRGSYVDKHQGLSMQERLNNLEFSDDEDDD